MDIANLILANLILAKSKGLFCTAGLLVDHRNSTTSIQVLIQEKYLLRFVRLGELIGITTLEKLMDKITSNQQLKRHDRKIISN